MCEFGTVTVEHLTRVQLDVETICDIINVPKGNGRMEPKSTPEDCEARNGRRQVIMSKMSGCLQSKLVDSIPRYPDYASNGLCDAG